MPSTRKPTLRLILLLALASSQCRSSNDSYNTDRLYIAEEALVSSVERFPLQVFDVDPGNGRLSRADVQIDDGDETFYSGPRLFAHPSRPYLVVARTRFRMLEIEGSESLTLLPREATEHLGAIHSALIRLHPNGRHIYAFHARKQSSPSGMIVFELGDGAATPFFDLVGKLHTLGCDAHAVALSPDGQSIYCSADEGRSIQIIDISDPASSFAPAAKFDVAERVREIVAHPGGNFVYALIGLPRKGRKDWNRGTIMAYRRTETAGRLTRVTRGGTTFTSWITRIAITPDGGNLYSLDRAMNFVFGFAIDAEGRLQERGRSRAGQAPSEILIHPTGRFVYVVNKKSSDLTAFTVGEGGKLVPMPNSPIALDSPPVAIAFGR